MNIVIEALSQQLHFETKEVKNIVTVRLPSGVRIEALVSEQDVGKLINEVAGANSHQEAPSSSSRRHEPPPIATRANFDMDEEGVTSFGGDVPTSSESAPPPPPPAVRPATVLKDEAGNPILTGAGYVDPSKILGRDDGSREQDEDGVAQA
jgi:hypothetical protein